MECRICIPEDAPTCEDAEHALATERRAASAGAQWSSIDFGGGYRVSLEGRSISTGDGLELQSIVHRLDDFGHYIDYLPEGTLVRYEIVCNDQGAWPMLYGSIGGHQFTSPLESWMRFRWPRPREVRRG